MRALLSLICLAVVAPLVHADDPNNGAIGISFRLEEGELQIVDIVKGSPAEKAGLKKDDVILKINEKAAETQEFVIARIAEHKPGDKLKITIKRLGKEMTIEVTVGKRADVLKPKD